MKALNIQLKFELKKYNNLILKSVFFGGGTPSSIDAIYYKEIFDTLNPYINSKTELTTEANPNSASKLWQQDMKSFGVNRISFGVQSFDDDKLKFLGRNHNHTQAIEAIKNAKAVGYEHINCDIIYDTQKDTKDLLSSDLKIISTLPIDHISAYSLIIEENTKFEHTPEVRIENIDFAKYIFSSLEDLGFTQYEISNFSKNKNARSIHNYGYWQKENYIGVGSGAIGAVENKRYYCNEDVQEYINNPTTYSKIENLDEEDILFEKIFLGLRSDVGVCLDLFNNTQKENIKILQKENKITIKNNTIFNNDFLLSDEIVLFIDE
jgi:oxygen-independent coproporphyrinogen-3 oxidase